MPTSRNKRFDQGNEITNAWLTGGGSRRYKRKYPEEENKRNKIKTLGLREGAADVTKGKPQGKKIKTRGSREAVADVTKGKPQGKEIKGIK
ncbi:MULTISPECIES: hypothetical protein [Bartonella]|uniref:hypothetical protein n=1 Tax=Bartonella TaxID=773 RepID=UPI0018DC4F07|nr:MULTISPECIES: hypothetical protein [Bartonella]MBH9974945.1 hypothetical protein [Bartonella choladocola]MBI0014551.1 hypothetical protein [Bartonella sp. B10834G3]